MEEVVRQLLIMLNTIQWVLDQHKLLQWPIYAALILLFSQHNLSRIKRNILTCKTPDGQFQTC